MKNCKIDSFHVGIKALIFNEQGQVLLLERNHPTKKLYWDIPGGRLHKGESPMDTLIREIKEETGLESNSMHKYQHFITVLTDIRIPIQDDSIGLIFSIFHLNLSTPFQPILSNEHINFEWFTPFEASQKLKAQYPKEFLEKLTKLEDFQ